MELHIRGVSKTYANGVQALKGVILTIPAGMYGLLGSNGAGKSTLMRMIATLQEPGTGTITLGGIDVVREKDEVRKTLGYSTAATPAISPRPARSSSKRIESCQ
jgi:ABC-type multidrug transport system ATPase subunit